MASKKHTPDTVRAAVEASLAAFSKSTHRFAWADDSCCTEPWYYEVHVAWVTAWNAEGRKTDAATFLRAWLLDDERILSAFERAADFANGDPPGWPTRPGQGDLRNAADEWRTARSAP